MSTIIADNLTGKTAAGNVTVTSEGGAATFQLQQGLAKAWVNFNGGGTIAARDSFNVSGLTDNGTGNYSVSYSNNMQSEGYAVSGSSANAGTNWECWLGSTYGYPTTSDVGLGTGYDSPVTNDSLHVTATITGDLA